MKTIFISSTFKDFHAERDILQKKVLPALNNTASSMGEYVSFSDLRWGVDTTNSDDKESTILSVCLNEIDRSRPYMIVMLGDRYGFCPGEKAIIGQTQSRGLELEDFDISVTALEAEYGVLARTSRKLLNNILIYCRNIEGENVPEEYCGEEEEYKKKLEDLKFRLRNAVPEGHYKEYTAVYDKEKDTLDVNEFTKLVENDLNEIFKSEFEKYKNLNVYEQNMLRQWNYIENKAEQFEIFSDFAKSLISTLKSSISTESLYALYGTPGAGKSTMFSHVCREMKQAGYVVIPVVCGNTRLSSDILGILQIINHELEVANKIKSKTDVTKMNVDQLEKSIAELSRLAVNRHKKVLIAIDALETLPSTQPSLLASFMPNLMSANLKILFTCQLSVNLPSHVNRINMPQMKPEECRRMISKIGEYRGKQIYTDVIDEIIKSKADVTPLMLYLIVEYLTLIDSKGLKEVSDSGEMGIIKMLIETVKNLPTNVDEMAYELIMTAVNNIHSNELKDALSYMALSKNGIRYADIEKQLLENGQKISQVDFAWLINFVPEMFIKRQDGRVDFFHNCLRNGIIKSMSEDDKNIILKNLFNSFKGKTDELSIGESFWYAIIRKDYKYLMDCISQKWEVREDRYRYMEQLLYEHSLTDEGKFIEELIDKCEDKNSRLFFLSLTEQYRLNKHEYIISGKIYDKLLNNIGGIGLLNDEDMIVQTLSAMYGAIVNGKVSEGWYGSPLHQKIIRMMESEMPKSFREKYSIVYVSILYELGDCEFYNRRDLNVCLRYYNDARELCKLCLNTADTRFREQLTEDYYNITRAIADIYSEMMDERYVALYEECLGFYKRQNEIDERCNYGVALSALTNYYSGRKTREDRIKAQNYAEENVKCWKRYNSQRKHIDAKLNYAMACGQLAKIYYDNAIDEKQLRRALEYAIDSREGLNKLLEDNYDARISLSVLADINILIADIYRYLGDIENERRTYILAVETFKTAKNGDERCNDYILIMYERLANAELEANYDKKRMEVYLNEVLDRLPRVKDPDNRNRFEKFYHAVRGKAHLAAEENERSIKEFDITLAMLDKNCDFSDWFDMESLTTVLQCYGQAMDTTKSADVCKACVEFYKSRLNKYREHINFEDVQDQYYPIFFWIPEAYAGLIRNDEEEKDASVYREFLDYVDVMKTRELQIETIISVSDAINKCMFYYDGVDEEGYVYSLNKGISWFEHMRKEDSCAKAKHVFEYYLTLSYLELVDEKRESDSTRRIKYLEKVYDIWKYINLENAEIMNMLQADKLIADACCRLIKEYEENGNKKGISKIEKFMERWKLE